MKKYCVSRNILIPLILLCVSCTNNTKDPSTINSSNPTPGYLNPYHYYSDSAFAKIKIDKVLDGVYYSEHYQATKPSISSCILAEATIIKDFLSHFEGNTKIIVAFRTSYFVSKENDSIYVDGLHAQESESKETTSISTTEYETADIKESIESLLKNSDGSYFYLPHIESHEQYANKRYKDANENYYCPPDNYLNSQSPISLVEYARWIYLEDNLLAENRLHQIINLNNLVKYYTESFDLIWSSDHFIEGMSRETIENQIAFECNNIKK